MDNIQRYYRSSETSLVSVNFSPPNLVNFLNWLHIKWERMDYLTYLKDVVVLGDSGIGVRNKSE